ncbi:hypothetical protein [Treponema succinifaciens]|uniref:hypothetical protein n=1 Tax=Treponema succinifaciens TaxID=167 RepID=UPI0023F38B8E|nr:hypothetical protein [Treponema succinifaciens]
MFKWLVAGYGIENLDYKNLAEDLIENELSDLFSPKINRLFQQLRFPNSNFFWN